MDWLLLLSTLLLGGCCATRVEIYPDSRSTPEEAAHLFRAALLAQRADLVYECLSEGFKRRYGVKSLREFRAAYALKKAEFDRIAYVMERAEFGRPAVFRSEGGIRFARLPVRAFGHEATFLLVELPAIRLRVRLQGYEDYGPQKVDYHREWRGLLEVSEERIRIPGGLLASGTGLADRSEVEELRLHHEWFLHRLSEDLERALTGLSPAGEP